MDRDKRNQVEARRLRLLAEYQAGRTDEAEFRTAAETLRYVDADGILWALGCQSGMWYRHEDGGWKCDETVGAGDETPLPVGGGTAHGAILPIPLRSVFLAAAALLIFAALLALPAVGAPPLVGPLAAPSPRPPLSGDSDEPSSGTQGTIRGTVTDYSTGRPGQAVSVVVSGFAPVKTDDKGQYSVSGLAAGQYAVSLDLGGQGTPAQGDVYVLVDGQNSTSVNLGFYSGSMPVEATPVVTPAAQPETPPELPESGAASPHLTLTLLLGGVGLLLLVTGLAIHPRQDRERI